MDFEMLGNVGDFVGGVAVIASLVYLAIQIRQNTKALRSSSYHQAAEQTWNYCLAIANDASLAAILARRMAGESLTPAEQIRSNCADQAVVFGFENMLRLREEGLIDDDVWRNVLLNSMAFFGSAYGRQLLASRPGPLSARLLKEVEGLSTETSPHVG